MSIQRYLKLLQFFIFGLLLQASTSFASDLFNAVAKSDTTEIRRLVKEGANPNLPDSNGRTPLLLAVENSDLSSAQVLIDLGADPSTRSTDGINPYFMASVIKQDLPIAAILMKTTDNSSAISPYPVIDVGSDSNLPLRPSGTASLVHLNERFGYRFHASPDWTLIRLSQDGLYGLQSVVIFSLPPIWSDFETENISNAITVFAKEDRGIHSLKEAVDKFWATIDRDGSISEKKEDYSQADRCIVDFDQVDQGLKYRRRSEIHFRNGVCYHLDFVSTLETFPKNIRIFTEFCRGFQFSLPQIPKAKK